MSERTVFRFFRDKEALYKATDAYIQQYVHSAAQQIDDGDLMVFIKNTFLLFEKHETLMLAYMFSPFGAKTRTIFRKRFNQLIIDRISKIKKIRTDKVTRVRLGVIVSLINVKIWFDMKNDFGYSSAEIGQAIAWAIETLVAEL